jgi:hypothetical protein
MPRTPKIEDIDRDLDAIFEYSYLPKLVKKELISFIIKHRIDEVSDLQAKESAGGALMIVKNDGTRDVSINERKPQLWRIVREIGDEIL